MWSLTPKNKTLWLEMHFSPEVFNFIRKLAATSSDRVCNLSTNRNRKSSNSWKESIFCLKWLAYSLIRHTSISEFILIISIPSQTFIFSFWVNLFLITESTSESIKSQVYTRVLGLQPSNASNGLNNSEKREMEKTSFHGTGNNEMKKEFIL